jgi:hypothetical protein
LGVFVYVDFKRFEHESVYRGGNMNSRFSSQKNSRATVDTNPHERGDVPGWVLITLMTAGLVVVIWAMAAPALGDVFNNAIDRVLSV